MLQKESWVKISSAAATFAAERVLLYNTRVPPGAPNKKPCVRI
ncbi:MAG TPA: hypothetical protein VHO71_05800 [Caproiciproducens sp.]|nr:hypothetical protein [Caproiciproducens sp.]